MKINTNNFLSVVENKLIKKLSIDNLLLWRERTFTREDLSGWTYRVTESALLWDKNGSPLCERPSGFYWGLAETLAVPNYEVSGIGSNVGDKFGYLRIHTNPHNSGPGIEVRTEDFKNVEFSWGARRKEWYDLSNRMKLNTICNKLVNYAAERLN